MKALSSAVDRMTTGRAAGGARRRFRLFLCWTGRTLFATGLVLLGYVTGIAIQALVYQVRTQRYLDTAAVGRAEPPEVGEASAASVVSFPLEGDILGRLDISRLGVSAVVLQGTKPRTLRLGVGHITDTALPGQPGNTGIAGHRDTFFRALKDVRPNDEISIQTAEGMSRYQVEWTRVVSPGDLTVLEPTKEPSLTLVTCYPFYFLGPAPDRFVIRAHLSRTPAKP